MISSVMKRERGETRERAGTGDYYLPGVTGLQNRFSCRSATRQAPISPRSGARLKTGFPSASHCTSPYLCEQTLATEWGATATTEDLRLCGNQPDSTAKSEGLSGFDTTTAQQASDCEPDTHT
jgi:hypothetical protein